MTPVQGRRAIAAESSASMRSWPLLELHCHLEGAVTPEHVWSAAQELGVALPWRSLGELDQAISLPATTCSLARWGPVFDARRALFCSPEFVTSMTRRLLARYRGLGCRHVELRFNPVFIASLSSVSANHVVRAVSAARDSQGGMSVGLIVLATRHKGIEEALQSAEVAACNQDWGVVGFDLAGQERGHPASNFVEAFDIARRGGLRLTAHAGEESGPDSIRDAIDVLGVERIGHGLTLGQDPVLLKEVVRRGIVLEMCPISNRRTGVVPSIAEHPAIRYLRAGVKVTLNSDDPGLFGTTLRDDWHQVESVLHPSDDELRTLVKNGVEAAFLSEPERAVLRQRVEHDLAALTRADDA